MEHITRLQLWEYIDGEMAAHQVTQIKTHLQLCPACMEEYNLLVELETGMENIIPPEPAEGFTLKVTGKVIERRNEIVTPTKKIFLFALGFSFLVCFLLVLIFLQRNAASLNAFKEFGAAVSLPWIKMIAQLTGCLLLLFLFDLLVLRKKYISKTL